MTEKYVSPLMASIHETAADLHEAGVISRQTMRDFDALCLAPASPLTAAEIRTLRERENVSQPVFARYLNVSKNLVSDWERGVKKPGGPALRLLDLVSRKGLAALV